MRNVPNHHEIEIFIKEILKNRNAYLRKKYTKIDPDLPLDPQLNMIKHLKDMNVISDDEFDELKTIIIKSGYDQQPIGFSN
jgi:hypothetical protein